MSGWYMVAFDAPRWMHWPVVGWLCMVLRLDRRWVARGRTPEGLREDIDRLAAIHGFTVTGGADEWCITWPDDESHQAWTVTT